MHTLGQHVVGTANKFCSAATAFVYPPRCSLCRHEVAELSTAGPALCSVCRAAVASDPRAACFRCGNPVGQFLDPSQGCANCFRERFAFERVIRLGIYDDEMRTACIRGKHAGSESLSAALAELLWERECDVFRVANIDLVVSVPQYWLQRVSRPHNQAATIGRVLATRLNVEFSTHILCKIRRTPDQSSLSAQQRRQNLRRAFRVSRGSRIDGATVLLVDDILTTGTTANESAKALKRAGAKKVLVAIAAVVAWQGASGFRGG